MRQFLQGLNFGKILLLALFLRLILLPITPLMELFGLELVERGLSLANLGVFGYLLWNYRS
jgi:hypothetical protein